MAVIDGIRGLCVTIRVNGQDAPEYADPKAGTQQQPEGTAMVVSKYIESIDDAEFKVHIAVTDAYNMEHPPHTLNLAAYTDGQWRLGELCRPYDLVGRRVWERDIDSLITKAGDGSFVRQAFKFEGVRTSR